jgi:Ca2+-transporting ATPase
LWINLVAAVALALPLAFEAKEPNVMLRPPRSAAEPVLSAFVLTRTVLVAVLMTACAIGLFFREYNHELSRVPQEVALREGQTMTITAVVFFQMFYLFNCRSLHDSVFKIGVFSNPAVYVGIGTLLLAQALLLYAPPLQRVFNTAPLPLADVAIAAAAGAIILPVVSVEKWLRSRGAGRAK